MSPMTSVPAPEQLSTARLTLRRPTSRDAEDIFAYASDAETTRMMAWPRHRSLEDTRGFLSFAEEEWRRTGCGVYLVCTSDGELMGSTGLHLATPTRAVTGYIFGRPYWGRGFATEAATAMIELARALGVIRVEADVVASHLASARVLEKIGMQLEGIRRSYLVAPNLSPAPVDVRSYARILE
jgi:[ribosomal protein S5]-alanine N-acetyltransferase